MTGRLKAWDPVARKVRVGDRAVWRWPADQRCAGDRRATLVFMGNGAGKTLAAYDAKNGTKLWTFDAKTAVFAAPITYELDGVQYVAASVGGVAQGADYFAPTHARMLVFALNGKAALPEPEPYTPPPLNPPPSTASADVIAHGGEKYTQYCSVCHGANGYPGAQQLPESHASRRCCGRSQAFDQVVLGGGRADKGMGSFAKDLKAEDTAAIREYLISRANDIKKNGLADPGPAPAAAARAGWPAVGRAQRTQVHGVRRGQPQPRTRHSTSNCCAARPGLSPAAPTGRARCARAGERAVFTPDRRMPAWLALG